MKAIPILHLFLSVFEMGGGREREREKSQVEKTHKRNDFPRQNLSLLLHFKQERLNHKNVHSNLCLL
jgi:hypothetical protein